MGQKMTDLSEDQIRQNVQNDLNCAVAFLNMLRNDPEMLKAVENVVVARIQTLQHNAKLQPELEGLE